MLSRDSRNAGVKGVRSGSMQSRYIRPALALLWLFLIGVVVRAQSSDLELVAGTTVGTQLGGSARLGDPQPPRAVPNPSEAVLAPPSALPSFDALLADPDERVVRRIEANGSLRTADTAGTALLQLADDPKNHEVLIDTTAQDPMEAVGLARLLRVESSPGTVTSLGPAGPGGTVDNGSNTSLFVRGISAILALRADNSRAIYKLDSQGGLTRLALLPPRRDRTEPDWVPEEVAISDSGQIAYVARSPDDGSLSVFQTGQGGLPLPPVVGNGVVTDIGSLQSNGSGELVFLIAFVRDGVGYQAVIRNIPNTIGSALVEVLRLVSSPTVLRRPRIGPDGTVAFSEIQDKRIAFYRALRGGVATQVLVEQSFQADPSTYDYDVGVKGVLALRATPVQSTVSKLYLAVPDGFEGSLPLPSPNGGGELKPQLRPIFGAEGVLFFVAVDAIPQLDRDGSRRAGLYRVLYNKNGLSQRALGVAVPGQAVPGRSGELLTVTQTPMTVTQTPTVGESWVAILARYGDPGATAAPRTAFFRIKQNETLKGSVLLAEQGSPLPGPIKFAILRDLSLQDDGTLVVGGLQPGAGPVVAAVSPAVSATGTVGTRALQANPLLLAQSSDLQQGRTVNKFLGPPVTLPDRQLIPIAFDDAGPGGEGLFTLGIGTNPQVVAVSGEPALDSATLFERFADPPVSIASTPSTCASVSTLPLTALLGSPSAAWDAGTPVNVVFNARLTDGSYGLFQWNGTNVTPLGSSTAPWAGDRLERWQAGIPTSGGMLPAYLLSRSGTHVPHLFRIRGQPSDPTLLASGGTPSLTDIQDFMVTKTGSVFVVGTDSSGGAPLPGVFRLATDGSTPTAVALKNATIPRHSDCGSADLVFGEQFAILPDSAFGPLHFCATVVKQGQADEFSQKAVLHLEESATGDVLTTEFVGRVLNSQSAGTICTTVLGERCGRLNRQGMFAYAQLSTLDKRWRIYRSRKDHDEAYTVAEQKPAQNGNGQLILDPSSYLSLPCDSGPLFSLNKDGNVAYLASDGTKWGVYVWLSQGP
jgi:hypothetical protein